MRRRLIHLATCILLLGWASPALADLMGYWNLDEGAGDIVADRSGNGNDGTVQGAAWAEGQYGSALEFNGADSYVEIPTSDSLEIDEHVTVAAWINWTDDGDGWLCVMANGQQGGPWENYGLFVNRGSRFVYFTLSLDGGHVTQSSPGNVIDPDEWRHVAASWDGAAARIYVDGQMVLEQAQSGALVPTGAPLRLGHRGGSSHYFNGRMDDVAVFDHVLTEAEILAAMEGLAPAELAGDPVPEVDAVDIPRDTTLSWSPGELADTHDVYLGTAFEDVNAASRADPLGVLVSEGQTPTTYDPEGDLAFGQTYYWRIDEVNAPPDMTVFKGEVWNFTVEPFSYPIPGVVVTSNAIAEPGAGPENTVNGSGLNAAGQHSTNSADMFLGVPGDEPIYLQYEFDRVYKLHEMQVWNYNVMFELLLGFGIKGVTVEHSLDGADWTVLGDVELAQATAQSDYTANTMVDFSGAAVKFVKLTVNSGFGMMGQFGLSEVRFMFIPAHAREPQPADGAADVNVNATLAWRSGRDALTHDVYLGADAETLALADTVETPSYTPEPLDLGTAYVWKVDEIQETETWEGNLWAFTTQAFAVVDDFESYDDDANRIYETWVDGYNEPDNGSQVGNLESPFAEQTIVQSGRQSMPLFYDNTSAAMSEATYTFAAQDWTVSNIKSLSLQFRGAAENAGQLYIKINGTKLAYDGDAADIASTGWLPWNIDLAATGVNLSSVTSLTIGIEGAGVSGVLYVDDVRLYPQLPEYLTPTEPDSANLAGHWSFDEGSGEVAADVSGNGNDGAITDPGWEAGPSGSALGFNGFSSTVSIPAGAWGMIELQATLSVWLFIDSTVVQSPFTFAAFQDPAVNNSRVMSAHIVWSDSNLYFDTGGDADGFDRVSNAAGIEDYADAWIHWAFTKNAETGQQMIYRNGMLWQSGEGLNRPMTGVTAFTLGSKGDETGFWNGVMDEFRLYNRELTQEEILWLAGKTEPTHKPF